MVGCAQTWRGGAIACSLVPRLPTQVVLFGDSWTLLGRKAFFQNVKLRGQEGFFRDIQDVWNTLDMLSLLRPR